MELSDNIYIYESLTSHVGVDLSWAHVADLDDTL